MLRVVALCLFVVLVVLALPAMAEEQRAAVDAIFDTFMALSPPGSMETTDFYQEGEWMSAVMRMREPGGLRWYAVVFDQGSGEFVHWDDLFMDGDAAAERIARIAEDATYRNAYAEQNRITPVPRDNFAIVDGALTIYYPAGQLSFFSGRAGAFHFYAYELADLLRAGAPLATRHVQDAPDALRVSLADGALPGHGRWAIGGAMADAAGALGLVDVPDLTYDFAVYRFEDPAMRGVALLSSLEEDSAAIATISGIYAERIDFSGLCTGIATRAECVAALGAPSAEFTIDTADGYSLRPVGEVLRWTGEGRSLELHFVEGVLGSVLLYYSELTKHIQYSNIMVRGGCASSVRVI